MTLEDLERQGLIRRLPVDPKKVEDELQIARRDIAVAREILPKSKDWAYNIAYNAVLQSLRAFMFDKGYRSSGDSHHLAVIKFAELFFESDVTIRLDRMRRKRSISTYDTAGIVSVQEAENAIEMAENLLTIIEGKVGRG